MAEMFACVCLWLSVVCVDAIGCFITLACIKIWQAPIGVEQKEQSDREGPGLQRKKDPKNTTKGLLKK